METPEIIFELQWKKKQGITSGGGDIASIGIWDSADTSLDWTTFKSYLCQNLGTAEDISFAYIDSEGDEIPIESECEFQEALKFARHRARRGRGIVLKLDKRALSNKTNRATVETSAQSAAAKSTKLGVVRRHEKQKWIKPGVSRTATKSDKLRWPVAIGGSSQVPKTNKGNLEDVRDDAPPAWFKKYMQKVKVDIITEVKNEVIYEFRQVLKYIEANKTCCCSEKNIHSSNVNHVQKKRKKKVSDEDSSDANLTVEQRELKLLKKIEKLQKREKKLEKKLDSKLEKLENKTKRMLEKKSQSKPRNDCVSESKMASRKRADVPVVTYLMDAILLYAGQKPDAHIKLGECFTKVWHIMNTGTIPWTDKTELRLAWGTTGLEPQVTTVKCPALQPGEHGQICVAFKAPEFPGTFESYWHFYHMGVRFGHWISCAVIVDHKDEIENSCPGYDKAGTANNAAEDLCKLKHDHPVDLTVNTKSEDFKQPEEHRYDTLTHPIGIQHLLNKEAVRDAEYESDSDSDNLSVISCVASATSESDDEDKFVVVPMPTLSGSEEHTPANSIEVEACSSASLEVRANGGCSLLETQLNDLTETAEQPVKSVDTKTNMFVSPFGCSQLTGECLNDGQSSSGNLSFNARNSNARNIIYAADLIGNIVPIKVANKQSQLNITTSRSPDVFAVDSRGCSIPLTKSQEDTSDVNSTQKLQGDLNYENVSCQDSTINAPSDEPTSGNHSNEPSSGNNGNVIHILPETLMTGAVNVAASAISTAKAVISNLRTIPTREVVDTRCESSVYSNSQEPGSSTLFCMGLLLDMGFANKEKNLLLLKKHNNNVSKVVAELLSGDQAETGSNIPTF